MKKRCYFLFILAATTLFVAQSRAACGLTLDAQAISVTWDFNFSYIAVQFRVLKSGAAACDYGVGFNTGGASSYSTRRVVDGTKTLRYQVYKDSALSKVLKDVPDLSTTDDIVSGGFQTGANLTQTLTYYFEIPFNLATSPSLVGSGAYVDTMTMNLYEGTDPLTYVTPVDSASISISVAVNPMIGVSIINSGGSYQVGAVSRNVNFGTLSEGQSSMMDLRVRTNAGFNVTFSSLNNGRLKHVTPSKNSYVPYSFYVNGSLLNMSSSATSPVSGLTASGQTSTEGLAYPLKIIIGNVTSNGILGGTHQDEIIITATTTE